MYSVVKSCVKHCNSFSDFFGYSVGLRQGEIMSPVLVSLFLEDLELFLQDDVNSGLLIDDIYFIHFFTKILCLIGFMGKAIPRNL